MDRYAAETYSLQRVVGLTVGTAALFIGFLNILTLIESLGYSFFKALLNWNIITIAVLGISGIISGFWESRISKWMQLAIFLVTALISAGTTTEGDLTSCTFLVFGLILISEYKLGRLAIGIGVFFGFLAFPFALAIGLKSRSPAFAIQGITVLIGTICLIILYGAVLYRHEFRHRQDLALLETRVKERTVELEHALEERFAMLQEIHHRVKNNLQVIISLLRLEADRQGDSGSRASLEASVQRILAMALVHETLYDTDQLDKIDIVSYAKRLIEETRAAASAEFELEAEGATLVGLDFAVPFGLLLNELMSNSEKHAFPAGTRGKVVIRIESKDGIVLRVEDNGIGMSEDVHIDGPKTLGLNLVKVLAQQLGGKISLDRKSGTRWTIRFPSTEPVIRH